MKTLEHDTALARACHTLAVTPNLYGVLAAIAIEDPAATRPRIALRLAKSIKAINETLTRHADLFVVVKQHPFDQITLSQEGITLLLQIHQTKNHSPDERLHVKTSSHHPNVEVSDRPS
jgi:hypothetical protein